MYGAYTGTLTLPLFIAGFGFFCIYLFGDCYNDCCDFSEDMRNARLDKMTINGFLSVESMRNLSYLFLVTGFIALSFTDGLLLLFGGYYTLLIWAYSTPLIRLKRYNILGYIIGSSAFLFLPYFLNASVQGIYFTPNVALLSFFFFIQCIYIACQKDSTDLKDDTNLFIDKEWRRVSFITLIFATLSSLFLFAICAGNIWLLFVWGINASSKILNISKIWKREINRELRSKFILIEFLTPYLYLIFYLGGGVIGL
ncbi:MAG: hypothetical protein A7315_10145 [Candidatus Altiarchaeales archaeon WOR_SM1_79]|nr:MAG: hypothetical protein A7315_10145 [Candidatus Altiarchaeales archaeon WOR_SM1_79]